MGSVDNQPVARATSATNIRTHSTLLHTRNTGTKPVLGVRRHIPMDLVGDVAADAVERLVQFQNKSRRDKHDHNHQ